MKRLREARTVQRFGIFLPLALLTLSCASTNTHSHAHHHHHHAPSSFRWQLPQDFQEEDYPLDSQSRAKKRSTPCPEIQLLTYRGDVLHYKRPLKVNPFFRERLQRFEELVRDVSIEVYGRAPSNIAHMGSYNCRSVSGKSHKFSEHAFGNAIDVAGFDFPKSTKGPEHLRDAFRIRLTKHWRRSGGDIHAKFFRKLSDALTKRPDIFRTMLGPAFPGHDDHFHFDVSPHRYLKI